MLVAFGAAAEEKPPGGAAALALSRVLGIGGGVVLMEAASILLWPRTATQGCLLSLAEAAGGEPLLACVAAGAVAANFGDLFPGKGGAAASTSAAAAAGLASPRAPKRSSDDDSRDAGNGGGGSATSSPSPFSSPSGPAAAAVVAAETPPSRLSRERLEAALRISSPAINVVFFSLAGASLRLAALRRAAGPAAAVAAARLVGVYLGSTVGVRIAGVPRSSSPEKVWKGMVTQAGVALGLARSVAARFAPPMPQVADPALASSSSAAAAAGGVGGVSQTQSHHHHRPHGWGDDFAAAAAAVIVINMIVGPPLFRGAVISSGEVRGSLEERERTRERRKKKKELSRAHKQKKTKKTGSRRRSRFDLVLPRQQPAALEPPRGKPPANLHGRRAGPVDALSYRQEEGRRRCGGRGSDLGGGGSSDGVRLGRRRPRLASQVRRERRGRCGSPGLRGLPAAPASEPLSHAQRGRRRRRWFRCGSAPGQRRRRQGRRGLMKNHLYQKAFFS